MGDVISLPMYGMGIAIALDGEESDVTSDFLEEFESWIKHKIAQFEYEIVDDGDYRRIKVVYVCGSEGGLKRLHLIV